MQSLNLHFLTQMQGVLHHAGLLQVHWGGLLLCSFPVQDTFTLFTTTPHHGNPRALSCSQQLNATQVREEKGSSTLRTEPQQKWNCVHSTAWASAFLLCFYFVLSSCCESVLLSNNGQKQLNHTCEKYYLKVSFQMEIMPLCPGRYC